MAKVLQNKRADEIAFDAGKLGGRYFFNKPDPNNPEASMQLIISEDDAKELLEKHRESLAEVPQGKWPQRCKDQLADHENSRLQEAAKAFPDIIKGAVAKIAPVPARKPKEG